MSSCEHCGCPGEECEYRGEGDAMVRRALDHARENIESLIDQRNRQQALAIELQSELKKAVELLRLIYDEDMARDHDEQVHDDVGSFLMGLKP